MKSLYNHLVYLSPEEYRATLNKDNIITDEPPARHKVPISKDHYDHYAYVFPSARIISNYKHVQTSQVESNAAKTLFEKDVRMKCTLHYETTQRNSIDRDWQTLILVFFRRARIPLATSFLCMWGSWSNIESDCWDIPKTSISRKCHFKFGNDSKCTMGKKLMTV